MATDRNLAVVVLAAGKGTRMESDLPKVLHPLAGRPLIAHVMASLAALEPQRIVVVVGPDMEDVTEAVAPARTVVQDPQLGTGHAVLQAREALSDFSGDVLVFYGDSPLFRPQTLATLVAARGDAACAVLGFLPEGENQYGRLVTTTDGGLEAIVEWRDADAATRALPLCNSGVVAADGALLFELLDGVGNDNAKQEYYLTDMVAVAHARGLGCTFVEGDPEEVLGVNSRAELALAEAAVQSRLRAAAMAAGATLLDPDSVFFSFDTKLGRDVVVEPQVFFGPGTEIGDGVTVKAFSHIEGARVAAGATIGPFARLRPETEIGPGARVGNFVEVKKSSIEAGAKVNHLTYIGDARVGERANVGAGTITCNYDGFDKAFTDIGAGAFIGSNTALVAPVKIGDGAIVGAGSAITKDVEADALAVTRAPQTGREGWAGRFRASKKGD
ncbi:MAG: bifunctional UDP-N-acetylglucosamine diphosphorylase/glucosamine-1-phosphate N-acetyltransferase GlmU [Alphaproteobacteria bacterium]|jgi:bifunctional UDP-N-acetylglucosamine pyrophosphorylase/glucosamine-1-phosphate N-acetyltransferase|nr:bifunctional N-acetylglucosamine-1-phosphate uridyltransferase/glucosamine-1-phosphate acetyltransferase [Rhodospirillaceae bacterium]MDP6404815.1 bifunctional UDP-N-acetylglucosamine diphosphorylase/glucosamine-1-phosphate N-acetyltransferase GlmU [Alphaproteobacteria bacterium]MDP6624812.1 bifunctional UDP-N-acetylglucosamine diphosphorylase/glucosamine-1-phosphate N-acetyltransferase GlmU [Alphaproteobacteria bacterium]|tara:strand:+ start:2921 stop:4252 length:1332 start_codon:yes stop_codon:yes gene_type:complete